MRTWNHRVCRQKSEPSYGEYLYSIREDFGDYGYTQNPIAPTGESLEDLRWVLERMLETVNAAILKPDLILEDEPENHTGIAQAFEAVERMRELGYCYKITAAESGQTRVSFWKDEYDAHGAADENLPMAICLAAKAAMEGE